MEIRARLRELADGTWLSEAEGESAEAVTAEESIRQLASRLAPGAQASLIVIAERLPRLVGVSEAAAILGWDRRRVVTYVDRGRFPEPLVRLAGGRVWSRSDVEAFAESFRKKAGRRTTA